MIAVQRLDVQDELAALGLGDRRYDADLAAELVGRAGFTFANAFNLGCVERVDLLPALAVVLVADFDRQVPQRREALAESRIARDLAVDVADQPAEPGAQELEFSVGALELMRMGIAPGHDRRPLGEPEIALAQRDAVSLGEGDQLLDRPVGQPRVGRVRNRLRLDGRVDRDPFKILGGECPGLGGNRQALLDQRRKALLAEPLAPAGERRTIEPQLVPEHRFAAEELEVRVLDPAGAQGLVAQRMHVLQDQEPGHQPDRQRRMAGAGLVDPAELPIEETPIDPLRQPHQRMAHVDDLVQRRPEQLLLTIIPRLRHRVPQAAIPRRIESEIARNGNRKMQESRCLDAAFLQIRLLQQPGKPHYIKGLSIDHGRLSIFCAASTTCAAPICLTH